GGVRLGAVWGVGAAILDPIGSEGMSPAAALDAYTDASRRITESPAGRGAAAGPRGALAADLVVLAADPDGDARWDDVVVEATYAGGRCAWCRDGWPERVA